MGGCIYRTKDGECALWENDRNHSPFCTTDCDHKHPSNADRIRAMSDEELTAFLTDDFCEMLKCESPCDGQCDKRMLVWLKQVETGGKHGDLH